MELPGSSHPLPDHLLLESGSSGATGAEQKSLPDAGFAQGFQLKGLSYPEELLLLLSPSLCLHPLHSRLADSPLLPALPGKNLSGTLLC